jgi:hypothetical protein
MSVTREQVLEMDLKSIFAAVKDPNTAKEMQTLLKDRAIASRVSELMLEAQNREAEVDAQLSRAVPPSTEELAAEAQTMAAEPPVVAEPVVEEVPPAPPAPPVEPAVKPYEAEDAAFKAIGITVVRDANGVVTRYIEEYHVRDEDGTPIGRATHLEARTLPELSAKKQEVHTQATRAFHRLKKQKLTFKQEKTILSPEQIAEAARVALETKDPAKVTDVIHGVIESQYQKREIELRQKEDFETGRAISNQFMRRHLHDYNPCEANQKALKDYFIEHQLEFTLDNLEAAFQDLKEQGNKLAKVEDTVAARPAIVAANPAPVAAVAAPATPAIPVAEPPAAVPVSAPPAQPQVVVAPVVEATAPTPAAAPNVQPAARRPGVNGSLPPGTLSAQRPGTPDPALTRKEFLKTVRDMKPEVMKNKLKTDPQFVKQLESYGIRVR